jgi:hypothetical protein
MHFKCRISVLQVGGWDIAHGAPPGLVSPPTHDILKCPRFKIIILKKRTAQKAT